MVVLSAVTIDIAELKLLSHTIALLQIYWTVCLINHQRYHRHCCKSQCLSEAQWQSHSWLILTKVTGNQKQTNNENSESDYGMNYIFVIFMGKKFSACLFHETGV
jgi:hypothetical protein